MDQRSAGALSEPPEGVLVGESVPRENEYDDREETLIQEFIGKMKARGEPWVAMSEDELRERAIERLVEHGVIR